MNKSLLFCFLFFTFSSFVAAQTEEEGVLVLHQKNFDSAIEKHQKILVEFYTPWCGHCKKLAPEYSKAAKLLKSRGLDIPLAKVDSSVELDLSDKYNIQGYPMLKYFVNGVPIDYTGGRTDSEIADWVSKRTGTYSTQVSSVAELKEIIEAKKLVGVFVGPSDSKEFGSFSRSAMGFDDITFANSESVDVKSFVGIEEPVGIAIFKPFDEGKTIYKGQLSDTPILNFFDKEEYPSVMYFDQKTAEKVFGRNLETLFVLGKKGSVEQEVANLREVAPKMRGKIEMVYSYVDDQMGQRLANYLEVSNSRLPTARIIRFEGDDVKKFKPVYKDLTPENIYKFYQDFKSGRSKSSEKSEALPSSNSGFIKTVVGKNFHDIVMDTSKDVVLYFYAPWCGQCKAIEPAFEAVAQKNKSNSKMVFAKMDATANEVEGVAISALPTIRYYPAKDKAKTVDFKGEKTETALADFIRAPAMSIPFGKLDL